MAGIREKKPPNTKPMKKPATGAHISSSAEPLNRNAINNQVITQINTLANNNLVLIFSCADIFLAINY